MIFCEIFIHWWEVGEGERKYCFIWRWKEMWFLPFLCFTFSLFPLFQFHIPQPFSFLLLLSNFPFLLQGLIQSFNHNFPLSLRFSFLHFSTTLSFRVRVWTFMKKNGFKIHAIFHPFTDRVINFHSINSGLNGIQGTPWMLISTLLFPLSLLNSHVVTNPTHPNSHFFHIELLFL